MKDDPLLRIALFLLVTAALAFAAPACTDDTAARRALEAQGFTDISIGGYDAWACGDDDWTATHFTASNATGRSVEGTVCCGMLKSCTVRW